MSKKATEKPKTPAEKIEYIDKRMSQLEAQRKRLAQAEKERERKARTSRLCSRHGLLENYMPDLVTITDEQFEMFVKKAVANNYGHDILAKIVAAARVSASPAPAASGGTEGGANPPKADQSGA